MKKNLFLPLILLILIFNRCSNDKEGVIMTVTGPASPSEMGITLSHEHLLVDFIGADSTGYHRWNRDSVIRVVVPYLEKLEEHGVNTFIECTPAYLGRDPVLLKRISEETGMQILTNTGYYGAMGNKFVPEQVFKMKAEELASVWVSEFRNGIEETEIKPGFIKIGVDAGDTLSREHRLIVNAAILASKETGLVIASHTGPDAPAFGQLEMIGQHELPASSFIWVHAQRGSLEGNIKAAKLGAWVSLDNVNASRDRNPGSNQSTAWYVERLTSLKEAGVLDRILISHDAGWYRPGEPGGGNFRGFTDLFTTLIPSLKENGFTDDEIRQMLVINPASAFRINTGSR